MMGISIWQLLIVLVIVLLLFGTKRLRTLGGDLGTTIRGFKDAMKKGGDNAADTQQDAEPTTDTTQTEERVIETEPSKNDDDTGKEQQKV